MYNLSDLLVSPRFAGVRLKCESLVGDYIVAEIADSLYYSSDYNRNLVVFDVKRGVITSMWIKHYRPPVVKTGFYAWCDEEYEFTGYESSYDYFYHHPETKIEYEAEYQHTIHEEQMNGTQVRLLMALASHQVEGDGIIKGLKAEGFDLDSKIISNYLGGWTFQPDLTVEELIRSLKRREE